jgi:hypothetical protein
VDATQAASIDGTLHQTGSLGVFDARADVGSSASLQFGNGHGKAVFLHSHHSHPGKCGFHPIAAQLSSRNNQGYERTGHPALAEEGPTARAKRVLFL